MDASQSNHNQAHRLPQTGNKNDDAIVGLGLLSGMLGIFGFNKRKEHLQKGTIQNRPFFRV